MNIVIIGAGQIESKDFLLPELNQADLIIAVDGGLNRLHELKIVPNIFIGDCDSVKKELISTLPEEAEIIRELSDKDETDMELAVDLALKKNPKKITLLQAKGSRFDHSLVNYYLLFKKPGLIELKTATDRSIALKENENNAFSVEKNCNISFLSISEEVVGLTTTGLKWELKEATIKQSGLTISNVSVANEVLVKFQKGKLIYYEWYKE